MATIDDVAVIARELPEVTEHERHGNRTWSVAGNTTALFTIPHFDGYAAVLVQLRAVTKRALRDTITEAGSRARPPTWPDDTSADETARPTPRLNRHGSWHVQPPTSEGG